MTVILLPSVVDRPHCGVAAALYVETHEEAPRFGLIHPALPLFDLAAECNQDEHRNLDSTRSKNVHAG
jgi:hypothetical protein